MSWGFPGFRVGRSEYGTWWVSVGLPFGFRVTKRLGRSKDPEEAVNHSAPLTGTLPTNSPAQQVGVEASKPLTLPTRVSRNQEILERMKKAP